MDGRRIHPDRKWKRPEVLRRPGEAEEDWLGCQRHAEALAHHRAHVHGQAQEIRGGAAAVVNRTR